MPYISTREKNPNPVCAAQAIRAGLAPDGGLYMPQSLPKIDRQTLCSLAALPYAQRAAKVLGLYLDAYTEEELLTDTRMAYSVEKFGENPAPSHTLPDMRILELWHGPTCAFKDMALQLMPRLFSRALVKCGEKRTALILVATSGDTGGAALAGYRDVAQTKIQVYYPTDGVSAIQKAQMRSQEGKNISVCGIYGNFDDAQTGVKTLFADSDLNTVLDKNGVFLSSANSINWGRLVPQIAYYVSAYCDMVADGTIRCGEETDVCVPTGNFGNIFAAYLAKCAGVPFGTLVCASNENDVLTEFLCTGTYNRKRPFHTTISPSMDILISSNLERLLYLVAGADKTAAWMCSLAEKGEYTVDDETLCKIRETFTGLCADENETRQTIREVFEKDNYLIDPHTAVAVCAARKYKKDNNAHRKMLTVSTASPYKFAADVLYALGKTDAPQDEGALYALRDKTGAPLPAPLSALAGKPIRFPACIEKEQMRENVLTFGTESV